MNHSILKEEKNHLIKQTKTDKKPNKKINIHFLF